VGVVSLTWRELRGNLNDIFVENYMGEHPGESIPTGQIGNDVAAAQRVKLHRYRQTIVEFVSARLKQLHLAYRAIKGAVSLIQVVKALNELSVVPDAMLVWRDEEEAVRRVEDIIEHNTDNVEVVADEATRTLWGRIHEALRQSVQVLAQRERDLPNPHLAALRGLSCGASPFDSDEAD